MARSSSRRSFRTILALSGLLLPSLVSVVPAKAANQNVTIANFAYAPANMTVQLGERITWTNSDAAAHTVTSVGGDWASGSLGQQQTFSRTFDNAGSFAYICQFHAAMRGTVTVVDPAAKPPQAYLPLMVQATNTNQAPTPLPVPTVPTGARWSDPASWPGGNLPAAGAYVVIPQGLTITLDLSPPPLRALQIDGTLTYADRDLNLTAGWIMVHGTGTLQIGSPSKPYVNTAVITLAGNSPDENIMGMGTKFLGAMMGGKIAIYGEDRVSWTKLNATAAAGASQITLSQPAGWRVGERIVIASTALDPNEAEERAISAVNGAVITLDAPLTYRHWGTLQPFDAGQVQIDERAEVGLLSRNIVIQGDQQSTALKFGGHVMIMGSDPKVIEANPALRSSAQIRGVEFRRLGQFNRLGRYSFHWHLNGDSTGDFIENAAIHDSIQRGIVVHGTSNVVVKNNVVFNTPGHAISVETGKEMNNTFDHNLALLPRAIDLTQETLKTQGDSKAAAFWIKGSTNIFRNNTAAGGAFGGFWFDDPIEDPTFQLTFTANTVHSHGATEGAGVWLQGRRLDYARLKFANLQIYKNSVGFWPDNDNPASVDSSSFADNKIAVTGDGQVSNATIIGRTANNEVIGPNYNERWGGAGLRIYNNSASLTNVTFVNFADDASAVSTVACRNESVRIRAEAVRWINARPTFCAGDTVIDDVDGSFSGTGAYTMIVSDPAMFTSVDGCTSRADGATLCPIKVDYQYLFVKRDVSLTEVVMARRAEDGLDQELKRFPGFAVAIPGKHYTLNKGLADMPQLNLYLTKPRKESTSNADQASRVQVAVPVPNAQFKVWRSTADGCYTCAWLPTSPDLRKAPLAAATSLSSMLAADGETYFYDQAAGMLHLLLGPSKAVFLERAS